MAKLNSLNYLAIIEYAYAALNLILGDLSQYEATGSASQTVRVGPGNLTVAVAPFGGASPTGNLQGPNFWQKFGIAGQIAAELLQDTYELATDTPATGSFNTYFGHTHVTVTVSYAPIAPEAPPVTPAVA